MQINQRSTPGFRDGLQRSLYGVPAVAGGRAKDFPRQAVGVHADQHRVGESPGSRSGSRRRCGLVHVAAHQRQVALPAVHLALVGDHAELTIGRRQDGLGHPEDRPLMLQPVPDQVSNRQHLEPVQFTKLDQVGYPRHRAVVVHDLADDPGRNEPGYARQVYRGLCLPGADQHSAPARAQGKYVPGAREIGRCGPRRDSHANGACAISRRDAGGDTLPRLDALSESCAEARGVFLRHGPETQVVSPLLGQRQADESPAEAGHEVDGLRSDKLGRQGQVALVLAIFIVYNNHHAAGLELLQCGRNIDERGGDGHPAIVCYDRLRSNRRWTRGCSPG